MWLSFVAVLCSSHAMAKLQIDSVSVMRIYEGLVGTTTSEGVEYDSDKGVLYIQDQGLGAGTGQMHELNGDFATGIEAELNENVLNAPIVTMTGMVYYEGMLYVNSWLEGKVVEIDTSSMNQTGNMISGNDYLTANGLCMDPENPNMLYATFIGDDGSNLGFVKPGFVASIDLDNDWQVTELITAETNDMDVALAPNGCTVVDGVLYVVQFASPGSLLMYNITAQTWDNMAAPMQGDGVVALNGFLFMTAYADGLYSWEIGSTDDWVFWELDIRPGYADLCVAYGNVLAIPTFGEIGEDAGDINFVEVKFTTGYDLEESTQKSVNGLSVKMLKSYDGLVTLGTTAESVEYNADKGVLYLQDQGLGAGTGQMHELNAEFAMESSDAQLNQNVLQSPIPFMMGMVYNAERLYVPSFGLGTVVEIDTTTMQQTGNMIDGYTAANGLCIDPDNQNMLYLTILGHDGSFFAVTPPKIVSIDLDADWEVTVLYDSENSAAFDRVVFPNGCIVYEGILYVAEYADPAWLISYDIADESWTAADVPWVNGDGIVALNGYLFVTAYTEGLYSWKIGGASDDWILWDNLQMKPGYADMCLMSNNILAIPSFDEPSADTGEIYFVQITFPTEIEEDESSNATVALPPLSLLAMILYLVYNY